MALKRVPLHKKQGFVDVNPDATVGATVGKDLFGPDGKVLKLSDLTAGANSGKIIGAKSITGGGDTSRDRVLTLVGDSTAPGGLRVYGTNQAGTKGFIPLHGHVMRRASLGW